MPFKVNINCSDIQTLGVYLYAAAAYPVSLLQAKLSHGEDKMLDPGDYMVALIAQFAIPGTQIDCTVTGAHLSRVANTHHISATHDLLAFCAFRVDPTGQVS